MTNVLVIYHGGCKDGFAAAWAIHNSFACGIPEAPEFFAAHHGSPPPDTTGRDVIMVDFVYPRETMLKIQDECRTLRVLDHHKTAEEALKDFPSKPTTLIVFDMDRSGAGLAWDHFNGDSEKGRPWLIDYVEDHDLWRHKLPWSRERNAYIASLPFDFDVWDREYRYPNRAATDIGGALVATIEQYCRETSKTAVMFEFEGYQVPLVNASHVNISQLLNAMITYPPPCWKLETAPLISMGWWQSADSRINYSLRSKGNLDVGALAKKYGGGGHQNMAGFQVDLPIHIKLKA